MQRLDVQARFLPGVILFEMGRLADAARVFSQLADDYPELSELHALPKPFEQSRAVLEMAIRTGPGLRERCNGRRHTEEGSKDKQGAVLFDINRLNVEVALATHEALFSPRWERGRR
ncbi:hypothetical protein [Candidatus Accumulibacter sp. ACC003]|uniref:hypothetical protein n=1 Tax=Candidatus Accumulibacter sp. ACC003 TaxID=2823334 RepID=UPI0025C70B8F|nr:hypothetical protein [Candidatus Accumulibacter sp. ACC003]